MKSNKKINTVKLLDVVSIGGKNVKEFDNELMYLSTGDLEESNIVNLEPVTFDSRPSRANQLVEINDILFAKMKDTRKTLLINENTKNITQVKVTICIGAVEKDVIFVIAYFIRDKVDHLESPASLS